MMLLTFALGLQHTLSLGADTLALRTVRFAAGSFIPIVGSFVGESSKTLSASFQVVKSECGIAAILSIVVILIGPIMTLFTRKIYLGLAGAFGEMLGETKCVKFIKALEKLFDLMQAFLLTIGIFFVFSITLFLKTKGN